MSHASRALRDEVRVDCRVMGLPLAPRALSSSRRRDVEAGAVALILAGGRGERLQPLTRERAKPALPFAGVHRIIDFTLANCVRSGIEHIRVLTQYQWASVEEHIRSCWSEPTRRGGQQIHLCRADPHRAAAGYRGTADAVYRNLHTLGDARWVVVLGADHVYRMDYREMIAAHVESGADVTIAATEAPLAEARRMGVVTADARSRVQAFDEKPAVPSPLPGRADAALVSMGIYVFSRAALVRELISVTRDRKHDFGRDLIPTMVHGGARVFAYPFRDPGSGRPRYWRDIGTLDGYFDAHMELLATSPGIDLEARESSVAVRCAQPVLPVTRRAGSQGLPSCATVVRSVLGPRSTVAGGAHVEESVLLQGVTVERGATVRRAILDDGVRVAPGARLGVDRELDRNRFTVTDAGVVVVPRGAVVEA